MEYYDQLETQAPKEREAHLAEALAQQIAHAIQDAPLYARLLEDVEPEAIDSRAALARLPLTRRTDLQKWQQETPPFGGLAAIPLSKLTRVLAAPSGLYTLDGRRVDYWRLARALFAAGFRKGDLIHNAFSYHLATTAWMIESGAWALGCPMFPAGPEQPEAQLAAIAHLKPQGYTGPASVMKDLLEKAAAAGVDVSAMDTALILGEPLSAELRAEFKARGVAAFQCYATTELGLIAYETPALEGMVVDEGVLVEIVRPGTGDPLPEGEVGEVVVTTFNPEYPLIRFATGDLSAVLPGPSPCGRTNVRIRGPLGSVEQSAPGEAAPEVGEPRE